MELKSLTCKSCGSELQKVDDRYWKCLHCSKSYIMDWSGSQPQPFEIEALLVLARDTRGFAEIAAAKAKHERLGMRLSADEQTLQDLSDELDQLQSGQESAASQRKLKANSDEK